MSEKSDLLASQQEAVEHFEGPLLVLAGPGSGKTRVITRRIARLVERGVDSGEILAITFTNKAAEEMANRVNALLPNSRATVSTFHRFCARLLRRWGAAVGLQQNYSIFDTSDQRQLLRHVMQDLDIDTVHYAPDKIGARISRAKNDLQDAEQFVRAFEESVGDHIQAIVARVFPEYQRRLLAANAVDFDDLLLHVVALLNDNPEVRSELDRRHRFILVDEYQDTNLAQYRIVLALSREFPNLCVTGDPDQSIYGWRGAQIENILRFERDFPGAKVVRLEQNFRSTKSILRSADRLISHNVHRKAKSLVTENPEGRPVELLCFADGPHEAEGIARRIRSEVDSGGRVWSDFAVFYRVNALSREIEMALGRFGVPYQVAAGMAFFERAEIKDMLGYLRLIHNPRDDAAFLRIVNTPLRGIGKTTQSALSQWARSERINLWEAAGRSNECSTFSKRAVKLLQGFADLLDDLADHAVGTVEALLHRIAERTNFTRDWRESTSEKDQQRLANVEELFTAARQYDRLMESGPSLEGFLEASSLTNDVDRIDEQSGKVTLMTLHAAKGLEFPVVYITGVEQNLIPHERSLRFGDLRELEEERRLLFVGMTRAEEQLYLTHTVHREFRGRRLYSIASDFLLETDFIHMDCTKDVFYAADSELDCDVSSDPESVEGRAWDSPHPSQSDQLDQRKFGARYTVGMMVQHPDYGTGTVVQVGGAERNRTVTVNFEDGQCGKTFVVARSPLRPASSRSAFLS